MNGMQSHEWRSHYHPADRINELEKALKTLLANDLKFAGTFDGLEWNLSEEQMKLIQAALAKKEKP
jgi:hypothetical protein